MIVLFLFWLFAVNTEIYHTSPLYMNATTLKRKLKSLQGQLPESHAIRLHRAISWLKAAEEQEKSPDLRRARDSEYEVKEELGRYCK